MAANLSDLPLELIERIVRYFPNRDTLLQLRASNARAIIHFSTRPLVVSHLTSVTLKAPIKNSRYDKFWLAKGIDPGELGSALSLFTQLRQLALEDFGSGNKLKNAWRFMESFIDCLSLSTLKVLRLTRVDIDAEGAIKLVQMSSATMKEIRFDDVSFCSDSNSEYPNYYLPWSDVLLAMKHFQNEVEITVKTPRGTANEVTTLWDEWNDGYSWKGLTIELRPNDPDRHCCECDQTVDYDNDADEHWFVRIAGDSSWWRGVERICAFYLARRLAEYDSNGNWPYERQSDWTTCVGRKSWRSF